MVKLLILVSMAALAWGCGGSAGGASVVGRWSGVWLNNGDAGTANITVPPTGPITGTTHDDVTGLDATINGGLGANGTSVSGDFDVTYAGGDAESVTGTFLIDSQGHLQGELSGPAGQTPIWTITCNLVRQ